MQVNLSEKNQTINKNQGKPKRQKIEFPRKKKKKSPLRSKTP
jgi:hypothetical protein